MNWTSFSLLMLGTYSLYYGVNFLLDFLKQSANSGNGQSVRSLQLADSPQPVLVDESDFTAVEHGQAAAAEKPTPKESTEKQAEEKEPQPVQEAESGGVSLGEMIRLYRQKAIVQSARYDFST